MTASLFDALRDMDLLADRPESGWCPMYAECFDTWEQMGGVPADLSTVEALAAMALNLWREHKALLALLDDLMADSPEVQA